MVPRAFGVYWVGAAGWQALSWQKQPPVSNLRSLNPWSIDLTSFIAFIFTWIDTCTTIHLTSSYHIYHLAVVVCLNYLFVSVRLLRNAGRYLL